MNTNVVASFCGTDYLLSPDYNCGLNSKGNKFDEIIGIVVPLLKQHPDYRLYITGHSLGGKYSRLNWIEQYNRNATLF